MKLKITIGNGVNPDVPVQEFEIEAIPGQVFELDLTHGLEISEVDGGEPTAIKPIPGGLKIEFGDAFFVAVKHTSDLETDSAPTMVAINGEMFSTGAAAPDGDLAEFLRWVALYDDHPLPWAPLGPYQVAIEEFDEIYGDVDVEEEEGVSDTVDPAPLEVPPGPPAEQPGPPLQPPGPPSPPPGPPPPPAARIDLALDKTVQAVGEDNQAVGSPGDVLTVNVGDKVRWVIKVTNESETVATEIVVGDVLPEGVEFVNGSVTTDVGTFIRSESEWRIIELDGGASATLAFDAVITEAGTVTNYAEIISSPPDSDSTPGNESTTEDDDDTASVTGQQVDLQLEKAVSDSTPGVEDAVTWTLTLTNNDQQHSNITTATNITVGDVLPVGVGVEGNIIASVGSYDASTNIWTIPSLAAGGVATLSFATTVDQAGALTNYAEVTGVDQFDPDSQPDSTPDTDTPVQDDESSSTITGQQVDLQLEKAVSDSTPGVEDSVTWTLTLTNNDQQHSNITTATNITVGDVLPVGVGVEGNIIASVGSYDISTNTWTIPSLAAGGVATLSFATTVDQAGALTNYAEVTGVDQFDPDSQPDSTPDSDTPIQDDESSATSTGQQIDLELSKSASLENGSSDGKDISNVVFYFQSDQEIIRVKFDSFPDGHQHVNFDFSSTEWANLPVIGFSVKAGANFNTEDGVPNGEGQFFPIPDGMTIDDSLTPVGNNITTVEVDFDDYFGDEDPVIASGESGIEGIINVWTPGGGLTADIDDVVTWTVTVFNNPDNANTTATGVVIGDALPSGAEYVEGSAEMSHGTFNPGTGVWTLDIEGGATGLEVAETATLTFQTTVTSDGDLENFAEVIAADQFDPDSQPDTDGADTDTPVQDDESSATVTGQQIDLDLTKSVSSETANVGETVTWTLTLTNDNTEHSNVTPATGVQVGDALPAGVGTESIVGLLPSGQAYDADSNTWSIASLAAGESVTLTFTTLVTAAGSQTNYAEVIAADQFDPDSQPDTDGADTDTPVQDDESSATVTGQQIDLDLTKSVSSETANVGETVTWTLTLTNDSAEHSNVTPATGIQVGDALPAGVGTESIVGLLPSGQAYDADSNTWSIASLAAGESVTLTFTTLVTAAGSQTNYAEVIAADQFDPDSQPDTDGADTDTPVQDDESSATVTGQQIDLDLTKSVSSETANVGETVTWTLTLTNDNTEHSNVTSATGIQVGDALPAGVGTESIVGLLPSGQAYDADSNTWSIASLAAGESVTLTFTTLVTAAGSQTNYAEVIAADQFDPDSQPDTDGADTDTPVQDDESSATVTGQQIDLELSKFASLEGGGSNAKDISNVVFYFQNGEQIIRVKFDSFPDGHQHVNFDFSGTEWANLNVIGYSVKAGPNFNTKEGVPNGEGQFFPLPNDGMTINDSLTPVGSNVTTFDVEFSDYFGENLVITSIGSGEPGSGINVWTPGGDLVPDIDDVVTWTIAVFNNPDNANTTATGVVVGDVLPSGVGEPDNVTGGTIENGVWVVGELEVGETATLTFQTVVTAVGTLTNYAEIIAAVETDYDSTPDPDSNPENNTGEDDEASASLVGNDSPSAGTVTLLSDDADIAGANGNPGVGTNTTDGAGSDDIPTSATGTLPHNYGGDGQGSTLLTGTVLPEGLGLGSSVDDTGTILTVTQNGSTVLTVTLSDTTGGQYEVDHVGAVSHPDGEEIENNVDFTVNYLVTDSNGDTANGTLAISVDDDSPILSITNTEPSVVEEGSTVSGTWTSAYGADSDTTNDATGPATIKVLVGEHEYNLGDVVDTGKGTLTVNANGTWTFVAANGLDHDESHSASFSIRITDADGDTAVNDQTINITDGAGPRAGELLALSVDDEALPNGTDPNSAAEVDTKNLSFTAGSDPLTSFVFGTDLSNLSNTLTWTRNDAMTITGSDGDRPVIKLSLTAPETITQGTTGTVSVTATLLDNFDTHPDTTGDDLQNLGTVGVVATDIDNDSISGTVTLDVSDDIPAVFDETIQVIVDEDDLANLGIAQSGSNGTSPNDGSNTDGSITNDDGSVSPATILDLNSLVNLGADGGVFAISASAGTDLNLTSNIYRDVNGDPADSSGFTLQEGQVEGIPVGIGDVVQNMDGSWTLTAQANDNGNGSFDGRTIFTVNVTEDGMVSFFLFDQLNHADSGIGNMDDPVEDILGIDISPFIAAIDGDGDTISLNANQAVIQVRDDVPNNLETVGTTLTNADNSIGSEALGYIGNVGADEKGKVFFVDTDVTDDLLKDSNGTPLTVDGHNIILTGYGTDTLTGYVDLNENGTLEGDERADGNRAIQITLNPDCCAPDDDTYTVEVLKPLGNAIPITGFEKIEGVKSGIFPFLTLKDVDGNLGLDVQVTGFALKKGKIDDSEDKYDPAGINISTTGVAVGNQAINDQDILILDFFSDKNGNNVVDPDEQIVVNDFTIEFNQENPNNAANQAVAEFHAYDKNGTEVKITQIAVNGVLIVDNGMAIVLDPTQQPLSNDDTNVSASSKDMGFIVDGLGGGSGGQPQTADNDLVAITTAEGYSRLTIKEVGDIFPEVADQHGNSFDIILKSFSTSGTAPVEFDFTVGLTDQDGDNAPMTTGVHVVLNPPSDFSPSLPVVLDIDGDGLEFLGIDEGVAFDYNGDGSGEQTAWVAPDDAFLVHDANGDGVVNDGSEIAFADMHPDAETDLEGLRLVFDSNEDGVLDANDEEFASFGIFQDADSDGVTDPGEFRTLSEAGIESIGLISDENQYQLEDGEVTVFGEASFAFTNDNQGIVGDVALQIQGDNPADGSLSLDDVIDTSGTADNLLADMGGESSLPPAIAEPALDGDSDDAGVADAGIYSDPGMEGADDAPPAVVPT